MDGYNEQVSQGNLKSITDLL